MDSERFDELSKAMGRPVSRRAALKALLAAAAGATLGIDATASAASASGLPDTLGNNVHRGNTSYPGSGGALSGEIHIGSTHGTGSSSYCVHEGFACADNSDCCLHECASTDVGRSYLKPFRLCCSTNICDAGPPGPPLCCAADQTCCIGSPNTAGIRAAICCPSTGGCDQGHCCQNPGPDTACTDDSQCCDFNVGFFSQPGKCNAGVCCAGRAAACNSDTQCCTEKCIHKGLELSGHCCLSAGDACADTPDLCCPPYRCNPGTGKCCSALGETCTDSLGCCDRRAGCQSVGSGGHTCCLFDGETCNGSNDCCSANCTGSRCCPHGYTGCPGNPSSQACCPPGSECGGSNGCCVTPGGQCHGTGQGDCCKGLTCLGGTCQAACGPCQTQQGNACVSCKSAGMCCDSSGACVQQSQCLGGCCDSSGNCGCGIGSGLTCCSGACVNTQTSSTNCKTCGNVCTGETTCQSGQCVGCATVIFNGICCPTVSEPFVAVCNPCGGTPTCSSACKYTVQSHSNGTYCCNGCAGSGGCNNLTFCGANDPCCDGQTCCPNPHQVSCG